MGEKQQTTQRGSFDSDAVKQEWIASKITKIPIGVNIMKVSLPHTFKVINDYGDLEWDHVLSYKFMTWYIKV